MLTEEEILCKIISINEMFDFRNSARTFPREEGAINGKLIISFRVTVTALRLAFVVLGRRVVRLLAFGTERPLSCTPVVGFGVSKLLALEHMRG